MKAIIKSIALSLLIITVGVAGGFDISSKGEQTFSFKDEAGRNQATFFSTTPLEDITGMSSDIWGKVSFDIEDVKNTLKGEVLISTASLKSGIDLRDEHIKSANWLDAEQYPTISFNIKKVTAVEKIEDNKLKAKVLGEFTVRGVTKEIKADVTLAYLEESELTKTRAPGDLLGVRANFNVNLTDYGVNNTIVGKKVADEIEISVNIVGSNKI